MFVQCILKHDDIVDGWKGPEHQNLPRRDICASHRHSKYLLYGVNPLEGFSFRRSLFLRAAFLAVLLDEDWTLVLPPFKQIPHWEEVRTKTGDDVQALPWSMFFNISFLQSLMNVIEFHDYVKLHGNRVDTVVRIEAHDITIADRNNATMMALPKYIWEYASPGDCKPAHAAYFNSNWFPVADMSHPIEYYEPSSYGKLRARSVQCVKTNGNIREISPRVMNLGVNSVLLDRYENTGWDFLWSSPLYWQLRKAERFAQELYIIASNFIETHLPGEFLGAHVRSGDFRYLRTAQVRTAEHMASTLAQRLVQHSISSSNIFVASNMSPKEHDELTRALDRLQLKYVSFTAKTDPKFSSLHSGQVAIVDQIICSRAKHFIGTAESFFTGVIYDELEVVKRIDFNGTFPQAIAKDYF